MEEWTGEFIEKAQGELIATVNDWKYDYGASDQECATMLLWMVIRLNPALAAELDIESLIAKIRI